MPSKSTPAQPPPAEVERRHRLSSRGLQRIEVQVRREDAPLIRAVAAALADPDEAGAARTLHRRQFGKELTRGLKDLLAAAPLDDIDLTRSSDTGRRPPLD